MKKRKILMVAGDMDVGGIENQLMHLLRHADPSQFQIDFTSTRETAFYRQEIEALGGHFLQIPRMGRGNPIPYCRALYRLMKDGQYDAVHSHELFHSGIVLAVAALAGVPARYAHAHNQHDIDGGRRSLLRAVYNWVMRRLILAFSTRRLACSAPAGQFLYGKGSHFQRVYNSVDAAAFLPPETAQPEEPDAWAEVLHVGRMTPVKNQLFLADVAAELKKRGSKIRIVCAGGEENAYAQAVRRAVEAKGLQRHMALLGIRRDIPALMHRARAFVLPSRFEGMPLVLMEAQTAGLSCVAADTFSHEVDFGLGTVNWLPENTHASAWADAIETAVAAPKAARQEIARRIREKGFEARQFAETLCKFYKEDIP